MIDPQFEFLCEVYEAAVKAQHVWPAMAACEAAPRIVLGSIASGSRSEEFVRAEGTSGSEGSDHLDPDRGVPPREVGYSSCDLAGVC
jgi:hypothetical protein